MGAIVEMGRCIGGVVVFNGYAPEFTYVHSNYFCVLACRVLNNC